MDDLGKALSDGVDWTPFKQWSLSTNYCRCGAVYHAYYKVRRLENKGYVGVTDRPCPACGRYDNVRRSSTEPEAFSIGKTDVGSA